MDKHQLIAREKAAIFVFDMENEDNPCHQLCPRKVYEVVESAKKPCDMELNGVDITPHYESLSFEETKELLTDVFHVYLHQH